MRTNLISLLSLIAMFVAPQHALARSFDAGLAGFEIEYTDMHIPYREFAIAVMPGETFEIRSEHGSALAVDVAAGSIVQADNPSISGEGQQSWNITAPERAGEFTVTLTDTADANDSMQLHVLVMRPMADLSNGKLDGFRVGAYMDKPLRGQAAYIKPTGLVKVTAENRNLRVSPHFTLGQFISKQSKAPNGDTYVALKPRLLLKLELVLAALNKRGIEADTLTVMSGFRTPWYNKAIGNKTSYSQHLYGSAADIFVDQDRDGRMDDLNGDGRSTLADARTLRSIVEEIVGHSDHHHLEGGLAAYKPNHVRGAFVHLDVRGTAARWGS